MKLAMESLQFALPVHERRLNARSRLKSVTAHMDV
jgi:hypothetical protein